MPNKKLQDKYFTPSDEVVNKITAALNSFNGEKENIRGLKRAKDIVANKKISYAQMKRIKNYCDNYDGDGSDTEYILIGGDITKKWVDKTLGNSRDIIHHNKQTRADAGEENQFIKTHDKDKHNVNITKVRTPNITKGTSARNIFKNRTIYEEIDSIKYLIGYMDNNKNKNT